MILPRCLCAAFRRNAKNHSLDSRAVVAVKTTTVPKRLRVPPILVGICVIFLLLGARLHARQGGSGGALHVAAVQAKLFFSETGTFSEDILANPDFTLWNTPVGEGSAGAPSNSTFVIVVVEGGTPGTVEHKRSVRFTASYKYGFVTERGTAEVQKIQIQTTNAIGSFGKDGKSHVGFWLHDTGCVPVDLTAEITGQPLDKVIKKRIDFKCGE